MHQERVAAAIFNDHHCPVYSNAQGCTIEVARPAESFGYKCQTGSQTSEPHALLLTDTPNAHTDTNRE